jgi:hypothetical protein
MHIAEDNTGRVLDFLRELVDELPQRAQPIAWPKP